MVFLGQNRPTSGSPANQHHAGLTEGRQQSLPDGYAVRERETTEGD